MSEAVETFWPITWLGIRGDRYILDVGDKQQAEMIAIALAEVGRKLVQLHEPYAIALDAELSAKIRARLAAVRDTLPVDYAIRELIG